MQSPSCSVVIPSYNAVAYLPAAIASIEAQAVRDIEVLVFDDGSTDGTAAWLAQAQATRPWLRIFIGGGHGPARARNFLIEKANSDLVAFLDADDVWYAGKLAPQIAFHAAHPDCSFTFTDY
ncbi:MAG TPA: glycosyltransferase family A protein, partial [Rhizobiaceae bacterium]|nr:glycosyltransferase family A protein [Rhizobiaceae bacterium]